MKRLLYLIAGILASIQLAFAAIDINTAAESELDKLPGIGPTKAKAIVEDRRRNGPFKSVEDLKRVKGIGDKTFDELKSQITAGGGKAASAPQGRPAKPSEVPAKPAAVPGPVPAPAGARPGPSPVAGKSASPPGPVPAPAGARPSAPAAAVPAPAGLKPAAAAPAAPPAPAGAKTGGLPPAAAAPKPAGALPVPAGAKAAAENAGKSGEKPAEKK